MPLIEIESLSVTFRAQGRDVRAVQDVSFTVDEGESFGLVGESGSGKSTILRAICGMAPVTGGTIRINGQPLPTPRGPGFAAQVQMVFQDPYASLHPRHTIDRTLSEPLAIHGLGGSDARVVKALEDARGDVKYTEFPDGDHGIAGRVYGDVKVHEWIFEQHQ